MSKTESITSNPNLTDLAHQAERYKAQNQLLIQAYEKIHRTLDELKQTEDLLIESEKMASLGELVATISHEIKSPLGAISAASNIISEFTLKIPSETFKLARQLSEAEYEAVLPIMSLSVNKGFVTDKGTISEKSLNEFINEIQDEELKSLFRSVIMKVSLKKKSDLKKIQTILYSPKAHEILDYLDNFLMLKTSIWIVKKSVIRAIKFINEIKNFSYRSTDQKVEFCLKQSINNVLTIYKSKLNNIEIITDFDEVKIVGDQDRLSQVWINLINNAAQASDSRGKIELYIKEDDHKKWVSIKDYAGGIPKEIRKKIFQPFFTTKAKRKGTGLGLSVVKRIVEEHGGHIRFDIEDGIGTNAIVEFKKINDENINGNEVPEGTTL